MSRSDPGALRRWWAGWRAELAPHKLAGHRWLRPLAHHLAARELWRPHPEALARGVAIGLFWAFATPIAQIVIAAANCVWWRANIPAAIATTLITNPLTIGAWLWLAHRIGALVIHAPPAPKLADGASMIEWAQALGEPALIGMAVLAVGGAVAGYLLVRSGAWMWFHWRVARRASRRR
jgi:uncharacterized protein (DUF2062 family)